MNPEINNEATENTRPAETSGLRRLPAKLARVFVHNWPWKLLSLFLAICLWAGLITQDPTLTRERIFTDVPLTITGTETLRRNGLIVLSGLEDENLVARLRVEVPQREYNTVTYTNYNPRVDLSRISEPGEQQVKTVATSTVSYGTVEDISPDTITIVVDEYITNYRVPVSVNLISSYPEGFHGGSFSLDPAVVAVSGPKSVVEKVSRIHVDYDAASLKAEAATLQTALPMHFMDRHGNEIFSDLLEVTSSGVVLRSIIVKQTLYPIRNMPISDVGLITGQPAKGYQVTNVTFSPEYIRAAGEESILADIGSLFADSAVNVEGATESFSATVRIRKPSELEYISTATFNVAVTIEPVVISSTLPSLRLGVRGTGSGLRVNMDISSLSAVMTGPQLLVESIRPSSVSAFVDVTGLEAGEYLLPVQFHVEDADMQPLSFQPTPATVKVVIHAN